jgi:hypothetical protein
MHGVQGSKWERVRHLVLELKLDPTREKMGEEAMVGPFIKKCSYQPRHKW